MQQLEELDIKIALLAGIFLAGLYYFLAYDDGSQTKKITATVNTQIAQKKSTLHSINNVR